MTVDYPEAAGKAGHRGSVSGTMAWPDVCAAFANGDRSSVRFRRDRAVRDVVETLGPSDGRYHARRIRAIAAGLLADARVRLVDSWGDPVRWPALLLGTPAAFSPTTLRYLSHALWLRHCGLVKPGGTVVEIGVGFGGLAAMNAIVSGARTVLVDLPEVAKAALRMLDEVALAGHGVLAGAAELPDEYCVVSNYAFTELASDLQDQYLQNFMKGSSHGMIVSNTAVFASTIGGRNDDQLVSALRGAGLDARQDTSHEVLGPADRLIRGSLIAW